MKVGGAKAIRGRRGQSRIARSGGAVDTVITNAQILDHGGIHSADAGLRGGLIQATDTAAGQDIPRLKDPGLAGSDLLVVIKIDPAPDDGVDPDRLETDARAARGTRPIVMARLKRGQGIAGNVAILQRHGGLALRDDKAAEYMAL